MPPLNPSAQGVVRALEASRSTSNTSTPGQAVVVKVTATDGLEYDYSGADAGTGDVVIRLPRQEGIEPGRTLYAVILDDYGRVIGGSYDPPDNGGGGTDIGEDPVFNSITAVLGQLQRLQVQRLESLYPIPVSSGGIGNVVADPHFAFLGPLGGSAPAAPGFRRIAEEDLPDNISFLRLHGIPSTIAGYGITDAYTKAQVDAIVASVVADSNLPPDGDSTQTLMGDRRWHTLDTGIVPESPSRKYYSHTQARQAIQAASDNISYDPVTGDIGMVPVPELTQVHVLHAPVEEDHVVTLGFLQTQYSPSGTIRSETITVTPALVSSNTITTHWKPNTAQRVVVLWNGLDCEGLFTLDESTITLDGAFVHLTVGDRLVVAYHS